MGIRAVLWDVDDTLFDYAGADREGALRHIEAEGLLPLHESEEQALALWRSAMETNFELFRQGRLGFEEHRRERARTFLGRALTDDEADAWFGRYVARYEAAWRLFPDAAAALAAVAALTPRVRQAVLSNAALANQERKLRTLGVRDHFEGVWCSDGLGHAKPAPEAFLAACAALGEDPGAVVYVGDQLATDAVAARDAGLRGVWLDRGAAGAQVPEGVIRIRSLSEVAALVGG